MMFIYLMGKGGGSWIFYNNSDAWILRKQLASAEKDRKMERWSALLALEFLSVRKKRPCIFYDEKK